MSVSFVSDQSAFSLRVWTLLVFYNMPASDQIKIPVQVQKYLYVEPTSCTDSLRFCNLQRYEILSSMWKQNRCVYTIHVYYVILLPWAVHIITYCQWNLYSAVWWMSAKIRFCILVISYFTFVHLISQDCASQVFLIQWDCYKLHTPTWVACSEISWE